MKKDEIIELLKVQIINLNEQLTNSNSLLRDASVQIANLTQMIEELNARIASMEQAVTKKEQDIKKQKNINKGLTKISQNISEKIVIPPTKQEIEILEKAREIQRKQRKNNGAKRNMYPDMEVELHIVNPDDTDFCMEKARIIGAKDENGEYPYRTAIRYECVPMRFIKHVYRIYTYSQQGKIYEGKPPKAAFFNSNYDASFLAGIMQLRYMYSMPVERIVNYFEDNGFALNKSTANGFIKRASELLENVYKAIADVVLKCDYIAVDETYHKVLIPSQGSKKGYFWVIIGVNTGLIYAIYNEGSRSEKVILNELEGYNGTTQSDAFIAYKKLESGAYPNIQRIACLQHIKRKFIDCGDEDKDARRIVDIINELYQNEHKHKDWTVEDNLKWRSIYAPPILEKLQKELENISQKESILPKEDLSKAINHIRNEWSAIVDIFSRGDTFFDNNLVERYNRYFSISRRNSLFFGSHKGAERAAVLYSLALSCRMNDINFFDYVKDIIYQTSDWQPNTSLEKYRDLLPDRWKAKAQ